MSQLQKTVASLQYEADELRDSIRARDRDIIRLSEKPKVNTERFALPPGDIEQQQREAMLAAEIKRLQNELMTQNTSFNALSEVVQDLKVERQTLEDRLKMSHDEFRKKEDQYESERILNKTNLIKIRKLDEYQNRFQETQNQLKQLSQDYSVIERENKELKDLCEAYKQDLESRMNKSLAGIGLSRKTSTVLSSETDSPMEILRPKAISSPVVPELEKKSSSKISSSRGSFIDLSKKFASNVSRPNATEYRKAQKIVRFNYEEPKSNRNFTRANTKEDFAFTIQENEEQSSDEESNIQMELADAGYVD